jgi:hypothetical protein
MGTVVVGIFADHDGLVKLTDAIRAGGMSVERLRVISPDSPGEELASSGARFVLSGDAEPSTLTSGRGIITGMGGTGVPGLTESFPRVEAFHNPTLEELLSELDIPDGRMEDFGRALSSGRTVAGYNAGADVDRIKGWFSSAGAYPVEVF